MMIGAQMNIITVKAIKLHVICNPVKNLLMYFMEKNYSPSVSQAFSAAIFSAFFLL